MSFEVEQIAQLEAELAEFTREHCRCETCVSSLPVDLLTLHCKHPESFERDVSPGDICECHYFRDRELAREHESLLDAWAVAYGREVAQGKFEFAEATA